MDQFSSTSKTQNIISSIKLFAYRWNFSSMFEKNTVQMMPITMDIGHRPSLLDTPPQQIQLVLVFSVGSRFCLSFTTESGGAALRDSPGDVLRNQSMVAASNETATELQPTRSFNIVLGCIFSSFLSSSFLPQFH